MKLLISACLLGEKVRYDGGSHEHKLHDFQTQIQAWQQQQRIIPVCPETLGGLPTPRTPAEQQADGRIITRDGEDVSADFERGAYKTLQLAQQHQAQAALLTARSPSCGSHGIYDGSFSGKLIDGMGVTARLLTEHGIRCFRPDEFDQLLSYVGIGMDKSNDNEERPTLE